MLPIMDKDVFGFFQALANPSSAAAVLLFVLPGFVAFKVDQRLRPQEVRSWVDALLEIVVYSIVNDLLWSPLYPFGRQHGFPSSLGTWSMSIVVLIISPAILTWIYALVIDFLAARGVVPSPTPKPWDHFFQRIVKQQQSKEVGTILTLRDGRRIGGVYNRGLRPRSRRTSNSCRVRPGYWIRMVVSKRAWLVHLDS